jgi:hypothetical protein
MKEQKNEIGLIRFINEGRMNQVEMNEIRGGSNCNIFTHCGKDRTSHCIGGFDSLFRDCLHELTW